MLHGTIFVLKSNVLIWQMISCCTSGFVETLDKIVIFVTTIKIFLARVFLLCSNGHMVFRGLDWTSKTRTSKTRTSKTRTSKTRTGKTRTGKTRTSKTRTSKTRTSKTRTGKTRTGKTRTGKTRTSKTQTSSTITVQR